MAAYFSSDTVALPGVAAFFKVCVRACVVCRGGGGGAWCGLRCGVCEVVVVVVAGCVSACSWWQRAMSSVCVLLNRVGGEWASGHVGCPAWAAGSRAAAASITGPTGRPMGPAIGRFLFNVVHEALAGKLRATDRLSSSSCVCARLQTNASRARGDALQFMDYQNMRGGKVGDAQGRERGACWLCLVQRCQPPPPPLFPNPASPPPLFPNPASPPPFSRTPPPPPPFPEPRLPPPPNTHICTLSFTPASARAHTCAGGAGLHRHAQGRVPHPGAG
jgi:hypothetical protein